MQRNASPCGSIYIYIYELLLPRSWDAQTCLSWSSMAATPWTPPLQGIWDSSPLPLHDLFWIAHVVTATIVSNFNLEPNLQSFSTWDWVCISWCPADEWLQSLHCKHWHSSPADPHCFWNSPFWVFSEAMWGTVMPRKADGWHQCFQCTAITNSNSVDWSRGTHSVFMICWKVYIWLGISSLAFCGLNVYTLALMQHPPDIECMCTLQPSIYDLVFPKIAVQFSARHSVLAIRLQQRHWSASVPHACTTS